MSHILMVDDDPRICELVQKAFEHRGHRVVTVMSGEEALVKLVQQQPPFDACVLDWIMPGIGGAGVVTHREKFASTIVVVLTAYGSKENVLEALRLHVTDFIDKPLNLMELVSVVEKHISKFSVGDFAIETITKQAFYQGKEIDLSKGLFDLFAIFIKNPRQFFTYPELVFLTTGERMDMQRATEYLRAQLSRLRTALREITGHRDVIKTGWSRNGFGLNPKVLQGQYLPEWGEEEVNGEEAVSNEG